MCFLSTHINFQKYGFENVSVALREEHSLRVFGNRVLRRIFGSKKEEVVEDWRRLRNEELHNLYAAGSIINVIKSRRLRWTGHIARIGKMRKAYTILVGKPEGKRPLGYA
jgi:hypothetical protein